MNFKSIEYNTKEKQMECILKLKEMGRCCYPMVFFIGENQIGKFYVYYR